jgi:hypothetical protein
MRGSLQFPDLNPIENTWDNMFQLMTRITQRKFIDTF